MDVGEKRRAAAFVKRGEEVFEARVQGDAPAVSREGIVFPHPPNDVDQEVQRARLHGLARRPQRDEIRVRPEQRAVPKNLLIQKNLEEMKKILLM